jgi:hypothetical protein
MSGSRFPYEQSEWHCDQSERWNKLLQLHGPENVRSALEGAFKEGRSWICIHTATDIPKGFARQWLAWHDQLRADRKKSARTARILRAEKVALLVLAAASAAAILWILASQ